jgi:hypothetical protein
MPGTMCYYCTVCSSIHGPVEYDMIQGFEVPKIYDCQDCINNGRSGTKTIVCNQNNCESCGDHTVSIPIPKKIETQNGSRWVIDHMCHLCRFIQ